MLRKRASTLIAAAALVAIAASARSEVIAKADLQIQGSSLALVDSMIAVQLGATAVVRTSFGGLQGSAVPILEGLSAAGDLTGPGITTPIPMVTAPGQAFEVTGLSQEGVYFLQNVRLMNGTQVLQLAVPSTATIQVTNALQTTVTVRQLTPDELRARGITLDPTAYDAYEYSFSFLVNGQTVTVPYRVIINRVTHEITQPADESPYHLPPDRTQLPPRWSPPATQPFELLPSSGGSDARQSPSDVLESPQARPQVHAAIVIPNTLAVLHQFFAVAVMVTNGAPAGSSVTLDSIGATIEVPNQLRISGSNPPATFGQPVTITDPNTGAAFLVAQAQGKADWTLEGLKPGTYTVSLDVKATMKSPGQPDLQLEATPQAAVVVHDARFNITFSHPDTIRKGLQYSTYTFITNVSDATQTITLSDQGLPACSSGGSLSNVCRVDSSPSSSTLTIQPGETKSVEYRLQSSLTGHIYATAVSIDGDSSAVSSAGFQLTMGVSPTGVPLSPATLVLPSYARTPYLSQNLLDAQLGLFGIAYSLATAPLNNQTAKFPRLIPSDVFTRATDLARAGERIFIGEDPRPSLASFVLDSVGNSVPLAEWDQFVRQEVADPAGDVERSAEAAIGAELSNAFSKSDGTFNDMAGRFAASTSDRGPYFFALVHGAASNAFDVRIASAATGQVLDVDCSQKSEWKRQIAWGEEFALGGTAEAGTLALIGRSDEALDVTITPAASGPATIDLIFPAADGTSLMRATAPFTAATGQPVHIHVASGAATSNDVGFATNAVPLAPVGIVAARQDTDLDPDGHVVSVLFNRRLSATTDDLSLDFDTDVTLDPGKFGVAYTGKRKVAGAALSEDQRIIRLNYDSALSNDVQVQIHTSNLVDATSNATVVPVIDDRNSALLYGTVLHGDNTPVPGAQLALKTATGIQYQTADAAAHFLFEYVPRDPDNGISGDYTLTADAEGKEAQIDGAVRLLHTLNNVSVIFLGRGSAQGTVRYNDGSIVANAKVVVGSTRFSQFRAATTDVTGFYKVADVPVGPLTFSAQDGAGNTAYAANQLGAAGQIAVQDITIYRQPFPGTGSVRGRVVRSDTGAPVPQTHVGVYSQGYGLKDGFTDANGGFLFDKVPAGFVTVLAENYRIAPASIAVDFDLHPNESHDAGDLTLAVSSSATVMVAIEGDVTLEDTLNRGVFHPSPNAQVQIEGMPGIVADSAGHYRYDSVPQSLSGRTISAYDPGSARSTSKKLPDLAAPSATTPTNNVPIAIPSSSGSGTGIVRVHLLGASGQPVNGYHVFGPGFPPLESVATGSGIYEFQNLPVGQQLTIVAAPFTVDPTYGYQVTQGGGSVSFAGQISAVTLHLPGQGTVTANIQQQTQAGVLVKLAGTLQLMFSVWNNNEQQMKLTSVTASTDGTNDAVFAQVPAQQSVLVQTLNAAGYASAGATIGYDGAVVSKSLVLSTLAEATGHVVAPDGYTPVAGASVHMIDGAQDLGTTLTGVDGSFDFRNMTPGSSFTVTAESAQNGIDRMAMTSGSTPANGGVIDNITLILMQQGSVEGSVVDANSNPIPFARVQLRELSYPARTLPSATDPQIADATGHFRFNNVFAVPVRVTAIDPNNPDSRGDWNGVVANEADVIEAPVVVGSAGTGSARITVVDPNSGLAPVANAEVSLYRGGNVFDFATTDITGSAQFNQLPVDNYTASAYSKALGKSGSTPSFAVAKEQTAAVSITLDFSGEVDGSLTDPQNNSATVPGSNVTLYGNGFSTRDTTAPDGSFDFKGVREGAFRLGARDPNSNRMARGTGLISAEYPTATVPLVLEPTSTLTVKAFLPNDSGGNSGVLAPLVTIDVTQNSEGGPYERNTQTNGAQFPGLVRNHDRTIVPFHVQVEEVGGLRRSASASDSFDSSSGAKEIDLVFSASGAVNVTVQQGNPPVAAPNVQVTASSGGVSRSAYTDSTGVVSFSGLPLGTVSVQATSGGSVPLTGATSVALISQATAASATIVLGSYNGISGKVLAEGGASPSAATRVLAQYPGTQLETRSDATGSFTFLGIATPAGGTAVTLIYIGPDDVTIGAVQSVTLPNGGSVVTAPTVTLDSTPPRLISIFPADGSSKVAPDTQLRFTFSRSIRPDQLNSGYFHLYDSTGAPLTLSVISTQLQADGSEVIAFAPPATPAGQKYSLRSNTLYRIMVSGQLQDLAAHFVGADLGASFMTSDTSAPQVVKIDPSPKLPLPQNGIRIGVTFSKPLGPAPWAAGGNGSMTFVQINALGGQPIGAAIAGTVQLDPATGATLYYAPNVALTPSAFYRLSISGVVDTDGRGMIDANGSPLSVFTQDFFAYDTIAPVVTINDPLINGTAIGSSDPLHLGVLYTIGVTLLNPDGAAVTDLDHVDFYSADASGNLIPITKNSATTVAIAVPPGAASFTLRADAFDLSLNRGTASRTWSVTSQSPLTIDSTSIQPAIVYPGSSVTDTIFIGGGGLDATVTVTASVNGNTVASGSQSLTRKLFSDAWPPATISLGIPRTTAAGTTVTVTTAVTDIRGNSATPHTDMLALASDTTPPVSRPMTIEVVKSTVSGSPSTTFNNGDQYRVHGYASDAETGVASMTFTIDKAIYEIYANSSGSLSHPDTGVWEFVSPAITVQSYNNDVSIAVTAQATDYAGNSSTSSASMTYVGLHDPNAPTAGWIAPLNGAAWPAGVANFTARLRVFAKSPLALNGTFDVPGMGTLTATRNGNELDATLSSFTTPAVGTPFQIVAHINDGDGGHKIDLPIDIDLVAAGQTIASGGTVAVDATHPLSSDSIVVDGGRLVLHVPATLRNLIVLDGGVVETVPSTTNADEKLDVTIIDRLYVDDASSIDVSQRGYLGGLQSNADNSGSNGDPRGMTLGRTVNNGASNGASGSYAGIGGDDAGTTNPTYGSIVAPADLGSGGAADASGRRGGEGGGAASMHASGSGLGNVVIAGSLLADGESGVNIGGAGSGGSIHIAANQIVLGAASKVSAAGGDDDGSSQASRAGGGGRISLEASQLLDIDTGNGGHLFASGGRNTAGEIAGTLDGGAGTIFLRNAGETNGELLISGFDPRYAATVHATRATPLTGTLTFDSVTLGPRALARADAGLTIAGVLNEKTKATIDSTAVLLLASDQPTLTFTTTPVTGSNVIQATSLGVAYSATSLAGIGSVTYALVPSVAAQTDTYAFLTTATQSTSLAIPANAAPGAGTLTIHVVDRAGRTADATPSTFTIVANQPPAIIAFDVTPLQIYAGGSVGVSATATDDVAVTSLELTATNAAVTSNALVVNGATTSRTFGITTPKTLPGGSSVSLTLTANDNYATHSVTQQKSVIILHDANPPSVTITSPAANATFEVSSLVSIPIRATVIDAETGVVSVWASIGGGAAIPMVPDPATPNGWMANAPVPAVDGTNPVAEQIVVYANDYEPNSGSSAPLQIFVKPAIDPLAPITAWTCPSEGAMFPPGYTARLRVSAVAAKPENGVSGVNFYVANSPAAYPATNVAGTTTWEANVPLPAGNDGDLVPLRVVAGAVGGQSAQVQMTVTLVTGDTIASTATISAGDTSHDGHTVIVTGGTLTIDGPHTFQRLVVLDGAAVTHLPIAANPNASLNLTVTDRAYISCLGAIDVSGQGYAGGQTLPGAIAPSGTSGGSHMGDGVASSGSSAGSTYGSVRRPAEAGAGGGGGIVSMTAATLAVDGAVRANGAHGTTNGAGGSIRISTTTLGGNGSIEAKGSCCGSPASGGGAIAIGTTNLAAAVLSGIATDGGAGNGVGGAGTVYVSTPSSTYGDLIVKNATTGGTTELPSLGSGIAQSGSGGATLVTDRPVDIPAYFTLHSVEVRAANGTLKGVWRIATITNKSVTLTPNGTESIDVQPGDLWRGEYRFDNITVSGTTLASADVVRSTNTPQLLNGGSIAGSNFGPPVVDASRISIATGVLGPVMAGTAGAVTDPDAPITVFARDENSGLVLSTTAASDGSFAIVLQGKAGDSISVYAKDSNFYPLQSQPVAIGTLPAGSVSVTSIPITSTMTTDANFRARRLAADGNFLVAQTYPSGIDDNKIVVFDLSAGAIQWAQTIAAPTNTRDVVVRDGVAYVAGSCCGNSMLAYDLSVNPAALRQVGSACNQSYSVAVAGSYAFLGGDCGDGHVTVYDISNPKAPVRLRDQATGLSGSTYMQLIPYGNYLIGITPNGGTSGPDVVVIDRRDINNLVNVAAINIPGVTAFRGSVQGTMLFVAGTEGSLAVLDISAPANPVIESVFPAGSAAHGIATVGAFAFVAADTGGVAALNVSNAAAPASAGVVPTSPQAAWDVVIHGQIGIIAAENQLVTFMVAVPPQVDAAKISIGFDGHRATVAGAPGSVLGAAPLHLEVRDVTSPEMVGGVAVASDGSFTATFPAAAGDAVSVVATDVNNATSGVVAVGVVPFGSGSALVSITATMAAGDANFRARHIAVDGNTLAVVNYPIGGTDTNKLLIFDLSSGQPLLTQTITAPTNSRDVVVRNNVAYVAGSCCNNSMLAYDLSVSPATLQRVGSACNQSYSIAIDGAYAFLGGDCGDGHITIYDITNPKVPLRLRDQSSGISGTYTQLIPWGNYLIGITPNGGASGTDVVVIDRRDINNLVKVSATQIPGIYGFRGTVQGSTLVLAGEGSYAAMATVDLSNPVAPAYAVAPTAGGSRGVAVAGNLAAFGDGAPGVTFFDISNPAAPRLIGTQNVGGMAWDVRIAGAKLYAAVEEGIAVIRGVVAPPVVDASRIVVTRASTSAAAIAGTAGAVTGAASPIALEIRDITSATVTNVAVSADGSFSATINAVSGDSITVVATDANGASSASCPLPIVPFGTVVQIPTLATSGDANFRARHIAVDGNTLAVVNYPTGGTDTNKLLIFDLSSGQPLLSQTITAPTNTRDVVVRNGVAYVAGGCCNSSMLAYDLSISPATLQRVGSACNQSYSVAVDGAYAFLGGDCGDGHITIYDITNPKVPLRLRDQSSGISGTYTQLIPWGNYLIGITPNGGASGTDVVVIDRRDINNLVKVSATQIPGIYGFRGTVQGSTLVLAGEGSYAAMATVDLSNPVAPAYAVAPTAGGSRGVAVAGNLAAFGDGMPGITFFDISNPAAPRLVGSQNVGGMSWDVIAAGAKLYVASEQMINGIDLSAIGAASVPHPPAIQSQTPGALRVDAQRIAISEKNGQLVVSGAAGAVSGTSPISIEIRNATLGTSVPVVPAADDGSFEAVVSASPGDHLVLRATSGIGEIVDVDLGAVPRVAASPSAGSVPARGPAPTQLPGSESRVAASPSAGSVPARGPAPTLATARIRLGTSSL